MQTATTHTVKVDVANSHWYALLVANLAIQDGWEGLVYGQAETFEWSVPVLVRLSGAVCGCALLVEQGSEVAGLGAAKQDACACA